MYGNLYIHKRLQFWGSSMVSQNFSVLPNKSSQSSKCSQKIYSFACDHILRFKWKIFFCKVPFSRKAYFCQCRTCNVRRARMLTNARKEHSIPLIPKIDFPIDSLVCHSRNLFVVSVSRKEDLLNGGTDETDVKHAISSWSRKFLACFE